MDVIEEKPRISVMVQTIFSALIVEHNTIVIFKIFLLINYFFSVSLFSLPVKRILNKPQIFRSDPRTDVNASQSRAGRSLQTKVQHSRHKHFYDVNHQIRVS